MDSDPPHGHSLPGNFPLHAVDSDSAHSSPVPHLLSCHESSLSDNNNYHSFPPNPTRQSPPLRLVSLGLSHIPDKIEITQHRLQLQSMLQALSRRGKIPPEYWSLISKITKNCQGRENLVHQWGTPSCRDPQLAPLPPAPATVPQFQDVATNLAL
eukprot:5033129-Ditylum_brightwellii.AAC.1